MDEPKFKVGDKVWIADIAQREEWIKCPDCFGDKYLTVILGDRSRVTIECAGCKRGFDTPSGTVSTYLFSPKVRQVTVEGIQYETGQPTKYKYNHNGPCWNLVEESDVFSNESAAGERADQLYEQRRADEAKRLTSKERADKSWAWNAHYHRKELKRCGQQALYHASMLNVAKLHAKAEKTPT